MNATLLLYRANLLALPFAFAIAQTHRQIAWGIVTLLLLCHCVLSIIVFALSPQHHCKDLIWFSGSNILAFICALAGQWAGMFLPLTLAILGYGSNAAKVYASIRTHLLPRQTLLGCGEHSMVVAPKPERPTRREMIIAGSLAYIAAVITLIICIVARGDEYIFS